MREVGRCVSGSIVHNERLSESGKVRIGLHFATVAIIIATAAYNVELDGGVVGIHLRLVRRLTARR